MNILTDIELEQRAAGGERDAFGALYERYSDRVYDFLLRMVREPAEAADLMQETFVRALRSLSPDRAGKGEFVTWLFTIARNLALTRMERAKRIEPLADEEEDESVYYRFDPDRLENPETAAQAFEMASLVWEASEALEPKQRTLLDLHVRQGLESAEIADVLGVSKGNAYTMISRLKDSFESAVAGLVMFRAGRRDCPELNRVLEERAATQLSPEVRKLIERHTRSCETCQGRRRELVSATALLRALVPVPLLPGVAVRTRDGAWMQAHAAGNVGGTATSAASSSVEHAADPLSSPGTSSAGHAGGAVPPPAGSPATQSGGLLSMPARVLHALPGPAWLSAAAAAVLVAAVAVPAVVIATRGSGGDRTGGRPAAAAAASRGRTSAAADVAVVPTAQASSGDSISAGVAACVLKSGGVHCWGQPGTPPDPPEFAGGVTSVSVQWATICAIKDGGAWCWGANNKGQLGNGTLTNSDVPVAVSGMSAGVTAISAGADVTCAVKDGGAWCWGANQNGQLGNGSTAPSLVPVVVQGLSSGVTAVSAGGDHSCAIKDGAAWCWGFNFYGQLGSGDFKTSTVPLPVHGMASGVTTISIGRANATCAIKDGGVWCWGGNFNGALGIPRTEVCGGDACSSTPLQVSQMESGVTEIETDGNYTCAVKDGAAWCWGFGHGIPRTQMRAPGVVAQMESGVTSVSVATTYSCGLKDGDPWCWGVNTRGELGDGSLADSIDTAVKVSALGSGSGGTAPTPTEPAPAVVSSGGDEDALWAAIHAAYPGTEFVQSCRGFVSSLAKPTCAQAGGWSAEQLASGIATVGFQSSESGSIGAFGRKADGSWGFFVTIANGGGGPLLRMPGDAVICADGDGLNLRAEPSTAATVVKLIPDGAAVHIDRFVLTEPDAPGLPIGGNGWYHITSPQEGWGYGRLLVPTTDSAGGCAGWWPRGG